ncbi:unnamed protein product, partial [marine sediment metagenome]
ATKPASHDDPAEQWTDEENAYNGDTSDMAYDDVVGADWGSYLELIHAGISNTIGVALYLGKESSAITKVNIWVEYGGEWHELYNDNFTDKAWLTAHLSSAQTVTKVQVRFYCASGTKQGKIYDTKFLSTPGLALAALHKVKVSSTSI